MPPYRASVAMMAIGLRRVWTSTTSAASWSLVCGRSEGLSVCSGPALAVPARSRAANGATKSLLSMGTLAGCASCLPARWGPDATAGKGTARRDGARRAARTSSGALLPLHHQRAGEGVRLDHALPHAEGRLQPAGGHSVLALGGALDHQIELVAQLPAVRGVAQLERALRVQGQPEVPRHGLRAQVTILPAGSGPIQTAGSRMELDLRRRTRGGDRAVSGDRVEAHRAGRILDPRVSGDGLDVRLGHARELHVAGHRADADVADALRRHVAGHRGEVQAAAPRKLHAQPSAAQRAPAPERRFDAVAEREQRDV